MKSMKLSATLYLVVLAIVSAIPILVGTITPITPTVLAASLCGGVGVVLLVALLIEPAGPNMRRRAHAQFGEVGEVDVAEQYKAVQASLEKVNGQIKEHAEKTLAEAKKGTAMAEGVKAQVDDLLTKQSELRAQVQDLAQKVIEGKSGDDADTNSLRAALEGGAEQVRNFISARNQSAQVNIPVPRAALTNTGATGTALNFPGQQALPQPLSPLLRRLTVRDLLAQGRTSKPVLFYQRESGFTNNAAPVSEGSLKPTSEIIFELITEPVRTLAHLFDISLQMLDDVDYIESYIGTRGMYGLKLVEEAQLLTGSGTGQNLEGIYTAATNYANAISLANETDIDKLRLAMLQVELAEAFTTGIVLHPTDWAKIELLKDTTGRYIIANPQNTTTGRIWGRDVVSTQAITQGRFLVGDFAAHAQIFDRQDANIAISFENKDNFARNMATIRVEERLALAIYRPEAFIKGRLETATGPGASL